MKTLIETQLQEIKDQLAKQTLLQKEILTLSEAAAYAGISKSFLYKLTSRMEIPFHRPMSKLIFFKKSELNDWLLQNRSASKTEIADKSSLLQAKQTNTRTNKFIKP